MFDFSWGHFIIVAVVALIVIGPKELPAVLRTIGQWTTKIRRMASEFQGQFQEAMREAEMADLKKEISYTVRDIRSQFTDPVNIEETTKWEPKTDVVSPDPSPEAGKPADAVTPPESPTIESPTSESPTWESPEAESAAAADAAPTTPDSATPATLPAAGQPVATADVAPPSPTPAPEGSGAKAGDGGVHP